MKKPISVLVLIAIVFSAPAQKLAEYRVVKVVGVVQDEVTGKALKTDDVIPTNHKLKFASKDARISVVSPEAGRKTITGVPSTKSFELWELLQSFVRPDQKPTGSRSGATEYLEHLQATLAFDTLLILSPGYFIVNTDKVTLKPPAAVKAWFYFNKKVNYRKVSDASGFKLDHESIFGEARPVPLPRVIIEYFEDETQDPLMAPGILIASFVPLYADETAMAQEIQSLLRGLPASATSSKKFEEIRNYLITEYAPPQESNLKQWLASRGLLTQ